MSRYAAFLRGVNLGKARRITMPALRDVVEDCEYSDVQTYISSGNLVLTAPHPADQVERTLAGAIRSAFGFSCDVFVRSAAELAAILADNPWPEGDPSQVTVALLREPPSEVAAATIAAVAHPQESVHLREREIYVHYRLGQANSRLAAAFVGVVGQTCTVRNLRTMTRVAALC